MGNASGYLKKLESVKTGYFNSGIRFGEQKSLDLTEIALHRMGWGYDRIRRFVEILSELNTEYAKAYYINMEQDIYQERMDGELRDIVKERQQFIPFRMRLPEVKAAGYDRLPKERRL